MFVQEDSFLNTEEQLVVYNSLLGGHQYLEKTTNDLKLTNWIFLPQAIIGSSNKNYANNFQFVATAHEKTNHLGFSLILNKLKEYCKKENFGNIEIFRTKANITTRIEDNLVNQPHIDTEKKHYVFLYYVNDSDGDTTLYKQKYGDSLDVLEINKIISPKMGRAIIFDGHTYHSVNNPEKYDYRCVINVNFFTELIK
jgi:hypothetical protein